MKKIELKEGMVLFNPNTKKYIHIKEITYPLEIGMMETFKKPYNIVCSDETNHFNDSMTTIGRIVLKSNDLGDYFYLDPISED